jgi:protein phosphatase
MEIVKTDALHWIEMLLLRPNWHGPFDIIGDVHGCLDELLALMATLGYRVERHAGGFAVTPPKGRMLALAGDLAMRGPATPAVLRLAMSMVREGQAFCVPGNQDVKLACALKGSVEQPAPGLTRCLEQFAAEPSEFRAAAIAFLDALPSHCVLDDGRLVIAHAGLPEAERPPAQRMSSAWRCG